MNGTFASSYAPFALATLTLSNFTPGTGTGIASIGYIVCELAIVTSTSRPNVISNPYARNGMYFIQRVTGIIVFAFILFHLWTTRFVQLSDHESLDLFRQVQAAVGNPWIYAFYIAGILSATWHLANGIWSFSIVWGLTVGPRAQRRMMYVSAAVFVILSFIGVRGISAFRL